MIYKIVIYKGLIPITKLFSGKVISVYGPTSRVKSLLSAKTLDWIGG